MGGYGSTRWMWHKKKDTVDDSRTLSIFDFKRDGLLEPNRYQSGSVSWNSSRTGQVKAALNYQLSTDIERPWIQLMYTITLWNGEEQAFDCEVLLQTTSCHYGGIRWWFTCPLAINDRSCGRRVAKLYLPPREHYFGCRHCYQLTYRSSQESDKRVNALKRLGPMVILDGINNGNIDLLMGLKALPDEIWR